MSHVFSPIIVHAFRQQMQRMAPRDVLAERASVAKQLPSYYIAFAVFQRNPNFAYLRRLS